MTIIEANCEESLKHLSDQVEAIQNQVCCISITSAIIDHVPIYIALFKWKPSSRRDRLED